MKSRFLLFILIGLLGLARLAPAEDAPVQQEEAALAITAVRYSDSPEQLRLVFDLSGPFEYAERASPNLLSLRIKATMSDQALAGLEAVKSWMLVDAKATRTDGATIIELTHVESTFAPRVFDLREPERLVVDFCKLFNWRYEEEVRPGLKLVRIGRGAPDGPVRAWALVVSHEAKDLSLGALIADETIWKRRPLDQIARAAGAYAAINGGYFTWQGPAVGLVYTKGRIVAWHYGNRAAIAQDKAGKFHIGAYQATGQVVIGDKTLRANGVNSSQVFPGGVTILTPEWGDKTPKVEGGVVFTAREGKLVALTKEPAELDLPHEGWAVLMLAEVAKTLPELKPGMKVEITTGISPAIKDVVWALGAGPRLLTEGKSVAAEDREGFGEAFHMNLHPRTAFGLTAKGDQVLIVVDGRQPCWSIGINLPNLAKLMKEDLDCLEAVNLDGGGSSALYLDGKLVNRPSDGACRAVSNGICLWAPPEE